MSLVMCYLTHDIPCKYRDDEDGVCTKKYIKLGNGPNGVCLSYIPDPECLNQEQETKEGY